MFRTIRSRSIGYNVSKPIQDTRGVSTNSLLTIPLVSTPRLHGRCLTTSSRIQQPSQTTARKIDIYLPQESAKYFNEDVSLDSDTLTQPQKDAPDSIAPFHSRVSSPEIRRPTVSPSPSRSSRLPKLVTTHHDLPSYIISHTHRLRSARDSSTRHKLNTSSVHHGTLYEYLIQSHLQSNLGFNLSRIGGRGDGGVDLIGTWNVPTPTLSSLSSSASPTGKGTGTDGSGVGDSDVSPPPPKVWNGTSAPQFRILLQAKRIASHRSPMPALMRELDGTILSSSTSRWISAAFAMHNQSLSLNLNRHAESSTPLRTSETSDNDNDADSRRTNANENEYIHADLSHLPTLGILVTTRPLTAGIEKAMASSRRCLMYICLEEHEHEHEQNHLNLPRDNGSDNTSGSNSNINTGDTTDFTCPSTKIRQIAWNSAASRSGLEGYNVVTRYTDTKSEGDGDEGTESEAVLMFQGHPLT